jgi:hypothetical protein
MDSLNQLWDQLMRKYKIIAAIVIVIALAIFGLAAGSHITANILDLTTGLTIGGGSVISSTTGSGAMVLGTSPTLTSPTITGLSLGGTTAFSSLTIGGGSSLSTSNQTGTGNLVLATSPTLATPTLSSPTMTGTAAGSVFTASTSLAIAGGTALTTTNQTGTGNLVLNTSPTIAGPTFTGTAAGSLLTLSTSLAIGGGTPLTSTNQTGTGNLVLSLSPTLTGVANAALVKTNQTLSVTGANYTTSATTLAAAGVITGLNFTGPVSLASNWNFKCDVVYSQATGAAANLWGVISAGTAPTSLGMSAEILTNQTGSMNASAVNGITGATATTVVTSTPSAFGAIGTAADMFTAHLWGTLEAPSNATPSQVGIAVASGSASDAVTVYRDLSACWWF